MKLIYVRVKYVEEGRDFAFDITVAEAFIIREVTKRIYIEYDKKMYGVAFDHRNFFEKVELNKVNRRNAMEMWFYCTENNLGWFFERVMVDIEKNVNTLKVETNRISYAWSNFVKEWKVTDNYLKHKIRQNAKRSF